jgi:hypothetical protein
LLFAGSKSGFKAKYSYTSNKIRSWIMNKQMKQPANTRSLLLAFSISAGLATLAIHNNSDLPDVNTVMAENISDQVCPPQPAALPDQRIQPQQEQQRNLRRPQRPSGMPAIVPAVYVELLLPADETSRPKVVI